VGQVAGLQVARRPARKRKHAASTLQGETATAAETVSTAAAAAASATCASHGGIAAASPAQCKACNPACTGGHSGSPPPPPTGKGSVAALLGASSSAQAAAQLHGMSRSQLFSFAAQVLARGNATACQAVPDSMLTCSSGAAVSSCMPGAGLGLTTGQVSATAGMSMCSSGRKCGLLGTSSSGCKAPAAAAAGLQSGLLPAVQLESFYSRAMSPAEAAAEAAAMAGDIVAAAKAAAAEKVNSSRSCSPCSSGFGLPQPRSGTHCSPGVCSAAVPQALRSSAGVRDGRNQGPIGSPVGRTNGAVAVATIPRPSQHLQLQTGSPQGLTSGDDLGGTGPAAGAAKQLGSQAPGLTESYVSLPGGYVSLGCTPDVTPHTGRGYEGDCCFGLLGPSQPGSAVQGAGHDFGWSVGDVAAWDLPGLF
jgi:hypothetical protein